MLTFETKPRYNKHELMLCKEIIRVGKAVIQANNGKDIRFVLKPEDRKTKGGE